MISYLVVEGGNDALVRDQHGVNDVDVAVVALDIHGLDKGRGLLAAPDVGLIKLKREKEDKN
jgi:hypothetical protein